MREELVFFEKDLIAAQMNFSWVSIGVVYTGARGKSSVRDNICAQSYKVAGDVGVAAGDVVGVFDYGLAPAGKGGDDEGDATTEVGARGVWGA